MLYEEVTGAVIKTFYTVYNKLGYGFLEKVYENAMIIELCKIDLSVHQQIPIKVFYDKEVIGEYYPDLLVAEKVIVELKSVEQISSQHEAQLLNYLKASDLEVGLLLNFGPEPKFIRKIFTNDRMARG